MSDQERLARQWAAKHVNGGTMYAKMNDELHAAAEFILANTKPETMADTEWSDEYQLQGATDNHGVEVVMLDMQSEDEYSDPELFVTGVEDGGVVRDHPEYYTPNGKRYELREVTEPEHPVVLETLNDYHNAPDGTIIATAHGVPWVKEVGEWWVGDRPVTSESIAYQPRFVLRWGWGK